MDLQFENCMHYLLKNPPAFVSMKYTSTEHRSINLTRLKNCSMSSGLDNFLSKERHILNRLLYQMNNAFKRHKFFQYAKRLAKLLLKINDMQKTHFFEDITISLELARDDSCRFLSAERFDYVVCNLFVFIRIFESIPSVCENCYKYLGNFLDVGHFAMQCCLFVGLVAIVRSECLKMANRLIDVYNSIIVYSEKLKPANDNYVPLLWPRKEEQNAVGRVEFVVKSDKTIKYMAFFEEFLKNYNKKMDFTTGLNRALLDKLQRNDVGSRTENQVEFGVVVERKKTALTLIKEEATAIETVKQLKLFYKYSVNVLKTMPPGLEKSIIKKAARLVRREYSAIIVAKKSTTKGKVKRLLQDIKCELLKILCFER